MINSFSLIIFSDRNVISKERNLSTCELPLLLLFQIRNVPPSAQTIK